MRTFKDFLSERINIKSIDQLYQLMGMGQIEQGALIVPDTKEASNKIHTILMQNGYVSTFSNPNQFVNDKGSVIEITTKHNQLIVRII